MKIAIGDSVRFMNEVGGGRVTAILSKDMVSVETQDGFEIPTYLKNLVVINMKLSDKDFQQVTLSKEPKKVVSAQTPKSDLLEVDLHIHQLMDDIRGLTNADMLKLQMETFRKAMESAIASGGKKIVFIHGVGDGVLKNELRRELGRKYGKHSFQDASFREYGFGATMVILRK